MNSPLVSRQPQLHIHKRRTLIAPVLSCCASAVSIVRPRLRGGMHSDVVRASKGCWCLCLSLAAVRCQSSQLNERLSHSSRCACATRHGSSRLTLVFLRVNKNSRGACCVTQRHPKEEFARNLPPNPVPARCFFVDFFSSTTPPTPCLLSMCVHLRLGLHLLRLSHSVGLPRRLFGSSTDCSTLLVSMSRGREETEVTVRLRSSSECA